MSKSNEKCHDESCKRFQHALYKRQEVRDAECRCCKRNPGRQKPSIKESKV